MFILYFALWVILNGRWTTEIGVFGVAFAAIAYLFTCKFMGYSMSLDFMLLKRAPHAARYAVMLLCEIVKANLTVMKMILDRRFEPQPHLVQFDANLRKSRHRVALANSITLTPGTITVSLDENHYVVHCLDTSMIDGLDNGAMVAALEHLEKIHADASAKAAKQKDEAGAASDETPAQDACVTEDEALQEETAAPAAEGCEAEATQDAVTEETAVLDEAECEKAKEEKEDGHEH
ncbi:MAG: Na+/H+ antiporter subunit E [Clostridia bacterium]|nr:Na+/H+ antiporter subunit E [Clostridia bacterium]